MSNDFLPPRPQGATVSPEAPSPDSSESPAQPARAEPRANQASASTHDAPAVRWFEVTPHAEGQRLDNFLLSRLKGLPRSHLYRVIRKGEVRINKKRCKPDTRLEVGDMIRVAPLRLAAERPTVPGQSLQRLLSESILFQDDSVLVLNKPAGVSVHAGTGAPVGIIEALRHMAGPGGYRELVHRLDKETSGCLLVACHGQSLKLLQDAFRRQEVRKVYLAITHGHWPASCREVDAALIKWQPNNEEAVVKVDADGKAALTRFECLSVGQQTSLVRASPVTGRTHQIRVHSQYAGHPLVGDTRYTLDRYDGVLPRIRQLQLHAAGLGFRHPVSGQWMSQTSPLRDQMQQLAGREGLVVPQFDPAWLAPGNT